MTNEGNVTYLRHPGCGRCGGVLVGRARPAHHWGSWCHSCHAWYPDVDGRQIDTNQPPALELIDGTPDGTVVRPVSAPEDG